jgi:hypothetical protein
MPLSGGGILEQDFQRFNAACGGADTDDGERLVKHGSLCEAE